MKNLFFILLSALAVSTVTAQENFSNDVEIGQQLMITKPSSNDFQHITIPRKNFILKKGGILNRASVENSLVTVVGLSKGKQPTVTLKRTDGKKFFNAYRTLKADFNKAINSGELKFLNSTKSNAIAK